MFSDVHKDYQLTPVQFGSAAAFARDMARLRDVLAAGPYAVLTAPQLRLLDASETWAREVGPLLARAASNVDLRARQMHGLAAGPTGAADWRRVVSGVPFPDATDMYALGCLESFGVPPKASRLESSTSPSLRQLLANPADFPLSRWSCLAAAAVGSAITSQVVAGPHRGFGDRTAFACAAEVAGPLMTGLTAPEPRPSRSGGVKPAAAAEAPVVTRVEAATPEGAAPSPRLHFFKPPPRRAATRALNRNN